MPRPDTVVVPLWPCRPQNMGWALVHQEGELRGEVVRGDEAYFHGLDADEGPALLIPVAGGGHLALTMRRLQEIFDGAAEVWKLHDRPVHDCLSLGCTEAHGRAVPQPDGSGT
jgi:hypothetical protein